MAGEGKRERSDSETGVDKGLPPITVAGDDLEKMNAVGGADDMVNRQMMKPSEEVVKVSDNDQAPKKKPRLIWTRELHNCFRDAVEQLGFNRAVPTKILELMNVEHLTRDNVASHLQKFRLQKKKREEEQAQAGAASGNVPKVVYPTMSEIPQQPCVLQNTMQGMNKECACLDQSQLAPSFTNHNLNMIQGFPSIQEAYGTPFKDVGVNRMSSVGLVHGLYDSNDPHHISKFVHNYGPLPPKPLVDSYAHNLTDRSYFHDTTHVPPYDGRHELSLADQGIISPLSVPQYARHDDLSLVGMGIISPSSVPQYDRRNELAVVDQGIVSPSFVPQYDRRDELAVVDQGIISPSFVPQYDRRDELSVVDQGIISHSLAREGLGVGMPHLPEVGLGGLGVGMPHLPEVGLGGLGVHIPHLPEAAGGEGIGGAGVGVTHPPEATGHGGLGVVVPHLPEAGFGVGVPCPPNGGLARMNVEGLGGVGVGMPCLPEVKVEGLGQGMRRQPEVTGGLMKVEGFGEGVSIPPEATGGDFLQDLDQIFDFHSGIDSALNLSSFWMNMEWDLDGKSIDDLFRR